MHRDELYFETGHSWRYVCDCGYVSKIGSYTRLQLIQRIHRHRHIVGLAGIYHHREEEGHDT